MLVENMEYYIGAFLILVSSGVFLKWKSKKKKKIPSSSLTLGLEKTHHSFTEKFKELLLFRPQIDEEVYHRLEEILIGADVGVKTTQKLMLGLHQDIASKNQGIDHLKGYLQEEILKILQSPHTSLSPLQSPHVTMVVGVNGVGKTTSIAKLTALYHRQSQEVLLAAADTFRAGAVDQLKVWGERIGVEVLSQQEGADPAAVAFDAVKAGEARRVDRVIIDTAGRLHTKVNLMEELKKVRRVIDKAMPGAPHETLLVVDATQGQNALQQAREFHQALGLTGILLTKLDGTAKGGIVIGIVDEIGVPIHYLGLGEKLEDLQPFSAIDFVEALFQ